MVQFSADIEVRVRLYGCPAEGLAALDWRRARGFSERLDAVYPCRIVRPVSEPEFRQLIAAGYTASYTADGDGVVRSAGGMPREFNPLTTETYGHHALITVDPQMTSVDVACLALIACRREAAGEARLRAQLIAAESTLRAAQADVDRIEAELAALPSVDRS